MTINPTGTGIGMKRTGLLLYRWSTSSVPPLDSSVFCIGVGSFSRRRGKGEFPLCATHGFPVSPVLCSDRSRLRTNNVMSRRRSPTIISRSAAIPRYIGSRQLRVLSWYSPTFSYILLGIVFVVLCAGMRVPCFSYIIYLSGL